MGKKLITYEDYIKNPMSRDNAVFSHREMYASLYRDKLDKIMVRENGEVKYYLYTDNLKGKYYVHIKIPSEVVPSFYYDVVVELSPGASPSTAITRTIKDYNVRFYSNDPSFVFTFAHAFLENGLFIEELKSKMSKEAIKNVAKEKNPSNQVGYVKSLYFAYLLMKDRGLFDKIKFESEANKFSLSQLLNNIEDADSKIAKRQEEGSKISKSKKIDKKKDVNNRNSSLNEPFREKNRDSKLDIRNTQKTKSSPNRNVKQSKGTKNIGKIKKF